MDTAGNTTSSFAPPAIKTANPRLKRRPRAAGRRHIAKRTVAPPASTQAAAVTASKPPIISGLPSLLDSSSSAQQQQQPEDASVTALSIPEKGPNMSSFCHAYIPAKRPNPQEEEEPRRAPAERRQPENNTLMAGPVVTIVDGEIVLQQPRRQETRVLDEMTTVVEDEVDTAIISASYSSFKTGQKAESNRGGWNNKETQIFYEALCAVGLDFGLMVTYFDKAIEDAADDNERQKIRRRTRRQLKNKHRIESAKRPELIQKAIWGAGRRESIHLLTDVVTDQTSSDKEEGGEKEDQSNADKPEEAPQVGDTDNAPRTEQTDEQNASAPEAAVEERATQEDNDYGEGADPFDDEENYIDDYDL